LLNFGVSNPVYALENGTQGWFLAGFALEHGSARRDPGAPEGTELERLRQRALGVAQRFAVPYVPALQVERWLSEENRTTYLLDVRSAEEFAAASLPGAQHAPGGQLVQATDQWIGVRGARLVLADGEGIRAVSAALWLRQMGHDASVLREGIRARLSHRPAAPRAALPAIPEADPNALGTARLIDLRPSMAYRKANLRGAVWSIRPRLAQALGGSRGPLILIAEQSEIAQLAAVDLEEMGVRDLRVLPAAKMDALALEATPESPADCDCIDFLFFTHGRHEGNREAALQYLKWETDLVHQLDPAERAGYRIIHEAIGQS
jgi:rhodanese-related sulfurtransferase